MRRGGVLISADCYPAADVTLAARGRRLWRDHLAATYGPREAEGFLQAWSHEDFYVPLPDELSLMKAAGLTPEVTWRRDAFAVVVATPTSSAARSASAAMKPNAFQPPPAVTFWNTSFALAVFPLTKK